MHAEIDEFCKIGKFSKSHLVDWTILNLSSRDEERTHTVFEVLQN